MNNFLLTKGGISVFYLLKPVQSYIFVFDKNDFIFVLSGSDY